MTKEDRKLLSAFALAVATGLVVGNPIGFFVGLMFGIAMVIYGGGF